jgi:hypothetical protein
VVLADSHQLSALAKKWRDSLFFLAEKLTAIILAFQP